MADEAACDAAALRELVDRVGAMDPNGVLAAQQGPAMRAPAKASDSITLDTAVQRTTAALDGAGEDDGSPPVASIDEIRSSVQRGELTTRAAVVLQLRKLFDQKRSSVDTTSYLYREATRVERHADSVLNVVHSPLYAILDALWVRDTDGWFKFPVSDAIAPGYTKDVRADKRTSLADMFRRLRSGWVRDWSDLLLDLRKLVDAAKKFNGAGSEIARKAEELKKYGELVHSGRGAPAPEDLVWYTEPLPPPKRTLTLKPAAAARPVTPEATGSAGVTPAPPGRRLSLKAAAPPAVPAPAPVPKKAAKQPARATKAAPPPPVPEPAPAAEPKAPRRSARDDTDLKRRVLELEMEKKLMEERFALERRAAQLDAKERELKLLAANAGNVRQPAPAKQHKAPAAKAGKRGTKTRRGNRGGDSDSSLTDSDDELVLRDAFARKPARPAAKDKHAEWLEKELPAVRDQVARLEAALADREARRDASGDDALFAGDMAIQRNVEELEALHARLSAFAKA